MEAWSTFTRPEWQPFKTAWLKHGLMWPPKGSDGDDDTSQRGLLWQVAEARPNDLGRWVAEAKGNDPQSVIAHVLARWHAVRDGINDLKAVRRG